MQAYIYVYMHAYSKKNGIFYLLLDAISAHLNEISKCLKIYSIELKQYLMHPVVSGTEMRYSHAETEGVALKTEFKNADERHISHGGRTTSAVRRNTTSEP